jgi:hypothetical protein
MYSRQGLICRRNPRSSNDGDILDVALPHGALFFGEAGGWRWQEVDLCASTSLTIASFDVAQRVLSVGRDVMNSCNVGLLSGIMVTSIAGSTDTMRIFILNFARNN